MSSAEITIKPAATAVVLRDGKLGLEVLLVQRNQRLAFHGGAWVFPGGRVDVEDGLHRVDDAEAARRAAVREAREESALVLDPAALQPLSHWTTPPGPTRRFATWFFLSVLREAADVVVDGGEIHAHRWLRPTEALAARARGELELPAPTFVTLSELSGFEHSEAALHAFAGAAPRIYVPRPARVAEGIISLYEGDVAYDDPTRLAHTGPRHRLRMLRSGWGYERAP
jgi:8-oxo-dGTP pyrophosphatase MutT (NUDIX family)